MNQFIFISIMLMQLQIFNINYSFANSPSELTQPEPHPSTSSLTENETIEVPESIPENVVQVLDNTIHYISPDLIEFKINIHEGFFAYLEKFELKIEGIIVSNLEFDPIVTFYDQTFKKDKQGLRNIAKGKAQISLNSTQAFNLNQDLKITLHYQACTVEYCLFPTTYEYTQKLLEPELKILNDLKTPGWMNQGILYSLIFIFFAGLLTSLTPCVYPLIPITIAVLGREKSDTKTKGFIKSSVYVLGLALTYSMLGILAATSGFMFGSLLSNIYFLSFLTLILFIAALSMFDVLEIKSPQFLNKFGGGTKKSYLGIFISGAFSGLVVGPCVGPVLVGVLSYISLTKDILTGFSFMFAFALGLGSLIIVLGTFSSLMDKIPRSGNWMNYVKKSLSFVFLIMIGYFLRPVLELRDLIIVMGVILFIFSSLILYKGLIRIPGLENSFFKSLAIFSILVIALASMIDKERFERFVGYSSSTYANTHWDTFTDEKLAEANANGQIVILDFYAEWCAACKELKYKTFADPRVLSFNQNIKWLYFDSTKSSSKLNEYKKRYSIMGLPTILLFDINGNLRTDLTLTGYESPDLFLERLKKLEMN